MRRVHLATLAAAGAVACYPWSQARLFCEDAGRCSSTTDAGAADDGGTPDGGMSDAGTPDGGTDGSVGDAGACCSGASCFAPVNTGSSMQVIDALAMDDYWLYWVTNGSVSRVCKPWALAQGACPMPIPQSLGSGFKSARSIATDGALVFLTVTLNDAGMAGVWALAADGGAVDAGVLIERVFSPTLVAVDAAHVYWADQTTGDSGVHQAAKDGTSPVGISGQYSSVTALVVDGANAYYATTGQSIYYRPLSAGEFEIICAPGMSLTHSIAVTDAGLAWTSYDAGGGVGGLVFWDRAFDACSLRLVSGVPGSLAVDSEYAYWTDADAGRVYRLGLNVDAGAPQECLASGFVRPAHILVDSHALYWADQSNIMGGIYTRPR